MRTKLMASVALAVLGMGTAAFGSATPYEAVKEATAVMAQGTITHAGATGDDANNSDAATDRYIDAYSYDDDANVGTPNLVVDPARGSELAGLVWAQQIGVSSGTYITNVTNAIIADVNANFGGEYTGDEAWGVAKAGVYAGVAGATSAIQTYYNTTIGSTNAAIDAHTDRVLDGVVGGGTASGDTFGIWSLSHHVLASDLVGSSNNVRYQTNLLAALGELETDESAVFGNTSTTQALATALWALKTAGQLDSATTGGVNDATHQFGNLTLAQLKTLLIDTSNLSSTADLYDQATGTFFTELSQTTSGRTEDLAYAILALKAFGDAGDAALIASLEATLAASISAVDGTPFNVDGSGGYSAQFSGAALQALPEPAALSLLALGGLGLLARRRRA